MRSPDLLKFKILYVRSFAENVPSFLDKSMPFQVVMVEYNGPGTLCVHGTLNRTFLIQRSTRR